MWILEEELFLQVRLSFNDAYSTFQLWGEHSLCLETDNKSHSLEMSDVGCLAVESGRQGEIFFFHERKFTATDHRCRPQHPFVFCVLFTPFISGTNSCSTNSTSDPQSECVHSKDICHYKQHEDADNSNAHGWQPSPPKFDGFDWIAKPCIDQTSSKV